MKGNNTLVLNEATIKAALQHYFDTVVYAEGQSPKVLSIKESPKTTGMSRFFDADVSSEEAKS